MKDELRFNDGIKAGNVTAIPKNYYCKKNAIEWKYTSVSTPTNIPMPNQEILYNTLVI